MHKLESFALSSGSKISKPFINQCYFPTAFDKYICISRYSKLDSKKYDYFDDVCFHINPLLEKEGIQLIQIGNEKDEPIFYTKNYNFLNINQVAYILNKSLLYFGNLNVYSSIASYFDKNIVSPSRIDFVDSIKPYWSTSDKAKIIQSTRKNFKPVNSKEEQPKTINEIYPEVLAKNILDSLNIKNNFNKIKTLFVGKQYNSKIFDIIPNFASNLNLPKESILNVRLDKHFDVNNLLVLGSHHTVNVTTDQVIDINLLKKIKDNIYNISFFINESTDIKEIEYLSSIGKPVSLLAKNIKNLNDLRIKFIDYDISEFKTHSIKDAKIKTVTPSMHFLSRKTVFYNGQAFNSYYSALQNKNTTQVFDNEAFWEDLDFLRIYEEKS